jgi:membrane associated rhomboid family serine protease
MTKVTDYIKSIFAALKFPLVFIGFLWAIQMVDVIFFNQSLGMAYGIVPRTSSRLYGILFSPFLHGSFDHIIGNSVMLLLLSWIICFYDTRLWFKTLVFGIFIGGFFTWAFGSPASHFGASGIVFALWGTIFGLSVIHKKPFFIIASLVLFASYGLGFLFGLIPQYGVSFAGHFGGLLAGFACAKQVDYNKMIEK